MRSKKAAPNKPKWERRKPTNPPHFREAERSSENSKWKRKNRKSLWSHSGSHMLQLLPVQVANSQKTGKPTIAGNWIVWYQALETHSNSQGIQWKCSLRPIFRWAQRFEHTADLCSSGRAILWKECLIRVCCGGSKEHYRSIEADSCWLWVCSWTSGSNALSQKEIVQICIIIPQKCVINRNIG